MGFCICICIGPGGFSNAWGRATADSAFSFFISSANMGKGANLGGLAGADAHCQELAAAVGAGSRTWRAYLSTQQSPDKPAINARDRIGPGPWFNVRGLRMAASVDDLHSANNKLNKENSLTEKGIVVNGRGDTPNQHDVLTGSKADGTAFPAGPDMTCNNWTSETTGSAMLGHHDRHGVAGNIDSTSWNQAHASSGCSPAALVGTGGNGYIYCFAAATAATGLGAGEPLKAPKTFSGFAWLLDAPPSGSDRAVYSWELPRPAEIEVSILSLDGRKLADLPRELRSPGRNEIRWNGYSQGRPLPRGFYLFRLYVK